MARTPRTPRIQASGKRWAHGPRLSTGLLDTCTPPAPTQQQHHKSRGRGAAERPHARRHAFKVPQSLAAVRGRRAKA